MIAENRCLDLWSLMKTARSAEAEAKGLTNKEKIRYRREAENHVSSDEHLYRVEWVRSHFTHCVAVAVGRFQE